MQLINLNTLMAKHHPSGPSAVACAPGPDGHDIQDGLNLVHLIDNPPVSNSGVTVARYGFHLPGMAEGKGVSGQFLYSGMNAFSGGPVQAL
jgi:hypothetical protein